MRRLLAISTALVLAALASDAAAGTPLWGFFVHDEDGAFVTGHWPRKSEITVGSGEEADYELDGLDPIHATVRVDGLRVVVVPNGEVQVDDRPIGAETTVAEDAVVRLGDYRLTFLVRAESYVEEEQETEPKQQGPVDVLAELEGTTALPPPGVEEAAARAALARQTEFGRDAYRFCHDENYAEGGVVGADFCAILDESTKDVCPVAAKTCPWEELEQGESTFGPFSGGQDGKGRGQGRRRIRQRQRAIELPVPPFIAYVVLGVLLVMIIGLFIKQLADAGWEKSELELAEEEIDEAALDLQSLPEARSHVLLRLAERALARGSSEEAAILLHLALLRHLDDEGLARYHPSKTNGDYLRSIRRDKPLAALFRGVANETERVRFGDGRVDGQRVEALLGDARTVLVPGSERPSPFAGPAATAGMIVLLSFGAQGCPEIEDTRAFYSHGPAGMAAFPRVLREAGLEPQIKFDTLENVPFDVQTVVFRTSASKTGELPPDLHLDDLLDRGATVVVIDDLHKALHFLPNTATVAVHLGKGERVDAVELAMPLREESGYCQTRLSSTRDLLKRDPVKLPRGHQIWWKGEAGFTRASNSALHLEPLLVYQDTPEGDRTAAAYSAQRESNDGSMLSGCLYVFSDRDLFTNASLTRRENARFVAGLFAAMAQDNGKIWIVERLERWGGGGGAQDRPDDPTKPLRASNLLPLLLQSLVSLGILYVFLGAAFGPLRDPVHTHHKAFVEHVEAIGRQYARCGLAGLNHAAASLARLVVMRNRERIRGGGAGWAVVAKELAEKHDLPEPDVRAALRLGIEGKSELGAPKLEDPAPSSERMLRTLSRLLGGRHAELALKPRRGFRRGPKS